jgi:hypothetical protein
LILVQQQPAQRRLQSPHPARFRHPEEYELLPELTADEMCWPYHSGQQLATGREIEGFA